MSSHAITIGPGVTLEPDGWAARLGSALHTARRERGASLREVARASGGRFSFHELRQFERGRRPAGQLLSQRLAELYGVELDTVAPPRRALEVDLGGGVLSAGGATRRFAGGDDPGHDALTAYLDLVWAVRNSRPGTVPLRAADLEVLAGALALDESAVVNALAELMQSRKDALRLYALLKRRSVAVPAALVVSIGVGVVAASMIRDSHAVRDGAFGRIGARPQPALAHPAVAAKAASDPVTSSKLGGSISSAALLFSSGATATVAPWRALLFQSDELGLSAVPKGGTSLETFAPIAPPAVAAGPVPGTVLLPDVPQLSPVAPPRGEPATGASTPDVSAAAGPGSTGESGSSSGDTGVTESASPGSPGGAPAGPQVDPPQTIVGTNRPETFTGGSGDDTIRALGGNDVVDGRAGNDLIDGGAGNDTLRGGDGDDNVRGGAGNDQLDGGDGDDTLGGDAGNDTLRGGAGNDLLSGGAGTDSLYGDSGTDQLAGGDGNDQLEGGDGDDVLAGDAGNDTVRGGAGDDSASGGAGNDRVYGDAGNDTLAGGAGTDRLEGGDGDDVLAGDAGNDTLLGDAGDDRLAGGGGADIVDGGAGNDRLDGGDGNDTLRGGDGDDELQGGAGNDRLEGGAGNDLLVGGPGNDTLVGGADGATAYGGPGNDTYQTTDGAQDRFVGGSGNDRVIGTVESWDSIDLNGADAPPA